MMVGEKPLERLGLLSNDTLRETVLTLAVATAARQHDRAIKVDLICDGEYANLLQAHPDLDDVVADTGGSSADLARLLKSGKYDALILLQPNLRNALAAFRARIPMRVGPVFRTYGILFNMHWFGRRRKNEKHEIEYSLEMLSLLTGKISGKPENYLPPPPADQAEALALLKERGIREDKPLVAIHPASRMDSDDRYSTLPWPIESFVSLARLLRQKDHQVIITGAGKDSELASRIAAVDGVEDMTGHTTLGQLAWILKKCDSMIGNSTGTLHLAAAVGTKVIGLYPPADNSSPVRWGPFGPGHKVFYGTEEECGRLECKWEGCQAYNCMDGISPEEVFEVAEGIIAQSPLRTRWESSTSTPLASS